MTIYEYRCKKCGAVQEKWHSMKEENKEPCENCKATLEHLERQLSPSHKHVSWSQWAV